MKIIQMHLWIVFQDHDDDWISVWYLVNVFLKIIMIIKIELEILGWTRLLEIVWRLLEIVGMWFEILIIKWSWEILEWDLRSWDHQMELEIVGDCSGFWNVVWDLDHQMELGDFGMWFEILRSSNGVGDSWRFWNVVGDHDHQIESWEVVKIHHDHYWFGDCEMIVIFNKNNVVNLSIHPSIHHDKK